MVSSKTTSGFEWQLADDFGDDYELIEAIRQVDSNPAAVVDVIELVLGHEQAQRLKEHVRAQNGRVKLSAMQAEITEIFKQVPALKNS